MLKIPKILAVTADAAAIAGGDVIFLYVCVQCTLSAYSDYSSHNKTQLEVGTIAGFWCYKQTPSHLDLALTIYMAIIWPL